ncbi:MAG: hypothetical protein VKP70_08625 [Cyanobacteriota bacterium]|nr:hypothetical protein [Cyanobacteriota bacterium]
MDVRVRLVHADSQQRVVQVQAFEGERCLGSALGEASSAEVAEDRARDRLRQRLQAPGGGGAKRSPPLDPRPPATGDSRPPAPAAEDPGPPAPASGDSAPALRSTAAEGDHSGPGADPDDWSADLSHLDQLLGSLGWGREEERIFLQRLFGQPSRGRLTRYADLMVLRRALEALPPGSQPHSAPLPLARSALLSQCDDLLARLGWSTERARQGLERQFAVTSRQRLSDEQLLAFNLLLEGELLGRGEFGDADHSVGSPSASTDNSTS